MLVFCIYFGVVLHSHNKFIKYKFNFNNKSIGSILY